MLGQPIPVYGNAGKLRAVPSAKWFLAAYIRDVNRNSSNHHINCWHQFED